MPVNKYFNNTPKNRTSEQELVESLVNEVIQISGSDIYYIPRESWADSPDSIYGEDVSTRFKNAYLIEMYLGNSMGYTGQQDFFSKFGLEIRESFNFVVASRAFKKYVPESIRTHPQEGDLIFVPTFNRLFEIKFAEEKTMFYTLGNRNPYIYELRCESFRYAHEDIATGVDEIDILDIDFAYTISLQLHNGAGDFNKSEIVTANTTTATVSDWQPSTHILKVISIAGVFKEGNTIQGANSGAVWVIQTVNDRGNYTPFDHNDNIELQTQANNVIDSTEVNPFGMP